jgi:uncharacterized protein YlxW (UPF0749 family)
MTVFDFSPDPQDEINALKAEVERLKADYDSHRQGLQTRNTELVETNRRLARELDRSAANRVRGDGILLALRRDHTSRRYFLDEEWLLLHPNEDSYLEEIHRGREFNPAQGVK